MEKKQSGIDTGTKDTNSELIIQKELLENIIDTIREPLIVLDQDLRVVSVSRSFYDFFKVKTEETLGQLIYDLGNKQWDIPKLRELLETILPQKTTFANYEVEHDFATIGKRIMLLNARQIQRESGKEKIILLAIEDITERRDIEIGLETARKELAVIKISQDEAQEYADSIINTIREPLIVLDQDLRVVSVSRSFYDFFEVNTEDTVGQLIYDLGNKQWDIPKLRELLETILPQEATFANYEVEHDFAAIGKRIMLLNARQIQRASGKEKIILLAIEDITERRAIENGLEKAHEELIRQKEWFEITLGGIGDGVIAVDMEKKVQFINPVTERLTGYTKEEASGKNMRDVFNILNEKTNLIAENPVDKVIEKGVVVGMENHTILISKDGSVYSIADSAAPIRNSKGKMIGVIMVFRDVTEEKKITDEITIKTDAIEISMTGILITNMEGIITYANAAYLKMFGYSNETEIKGRALVSLGQNDEKIIEMMTELQKNREWNCEFSAKKKDGTKIDINLIANVSFDEDGRAICTIATFEDITDRKKSQLALLDMTVELNRAALAKSEFLANMSHELRTPLNSIIGFSEVLYDETFGSINDKQKKYVNNILTSGKHLLLLINQILDMAKVESGKMHLTLSNIPTKSLLNEISMLVADMVSKKNLKMLLEIADDLPSIDADELKVKEILYNLLSNAVKFTPAGGEIYMNAKKTDSVIEILVRDTGIGIAPENMEKIFEGFFRVDTPYSRVTEGTGLGLPLSKKLVELHGGKLSVISDGLNKGTSIWFTLPIKSEKVVCDEKESTGCR